MANEKKQPAEKAGEANRTQTAASVPTATLDRNGSASEPKRKKAKRTRKEYVYAVMSIGSDGTPLKVEGTAPTIGQGRRLLETLKKLAAFAGMVLGIFKLQRPDQ